jgi:alpha-tubulin suppressor-like RCC1 family protein
MARRLSWLNVVAGLLVAMGSALVMPAAAADAAPSRASTVSAGYLHTCAVTSKGAARCWGANEYGQLGNNTTADSSTPVGVHGLGSKVKNVSSGYLHSCALTAKGRVWCWGNNSYGQLGDNSTTNSARPVAVVGLGAGVRAIDAGWFDTCAITAKGAVKCWGNNSYGQLGNNTTTSSLTPVGVHGLTRGVKAVSASYFHTCAITAKGAARCWGNNSWGELGDNTANESAKPVGVHGLTGGVKQISAGYTSTCAVTSKGAAKCWGSNLYGQLGDNSTTTTRKPVAVYGLGSHIKSVKAGGYHACALTTAGGVRCWGLNDEGQLGNNSTTSSLKPVVVASSEKMRVITAGFEHTCAMTAQRAITCWGYNQRGQLGDNTTTNSPLPVTVAGF